MVIERPTTDDAISHPITLGRRDSREAAAVLGLYDTPSALVHDDMGDGDCGSFACLTVKDEESELQAEHPKMAWNIVNIMNLRWKWNINLHRNAQHCRTLRRSALNSRRME
jgi:hypothetical protein